MDTAAKKQRRGDEDRMQIRISGHPVTPSSAKEPDIPAAQRVRSSLIDAFLLQNAEQHKPA